MAKVKNIEGLTVEEIKTELQNGAKFVMFQYSISVIFMSFKRGSDIYFIKADESSAKYSIGYTLISLVLGWWGIPWGPIYTIGSLNINLSGGKDLTKEVANSLGLA